MHHSRLGRTSPGRAPPDDHRPHISSDNPITSRALRDVEELSIMERFMTEDPWQAHWTMFEAGEMAQSDDDLPSRDHAVSLTSQRLNFEIHRSESVDSDDTESPVYSPIDLQSTIGGQVYPLERLTNSRATVPRWVIARQMSRLHVSFVPDRSSLGELSAVSCNMTPPPLSVSRLKPPRPLSDYSPKCCSRQTLRLICQTIVNTFILSNSKNHKPGPSSHTEHSRQNSDSVTPTSDPSPQSFTESSHKRTRHELADDQLNTESSKASESEARLEKRRRVAHQRLLQYACPFFRNNPNSRDFASDGKFEKCRTQGIKTDKLKEHIRRIHTKPEQCTVCGRRGDAGEIKVHSQNVRCSPPKKGILEVDQDTLEKERLLKKQRNMTWHQVFAVLFPDHRPPPPEFAQYFDGDRNTYRQRLLDTLLVHLEGAAVVMKALVGSSEFKVADRFCATNPTALGSPAVTAAAARLIAIISSGLSTPNSPTSGDVQTTPPQATILKNTVPYIPPRPGAPRDPGAETNGYLHTGIAANQRLDFPDLLSSDLEQYFVGNDGNTTNGNESDCTIDHPFTTDFDWGTLDWSSYINSDLFGVGADDEGSE